MSLRTILIIVGVFIVVTVYLFTALKRRRESKLRFDQRFSRLDIPDVILDHEEEHDVDAMAAKPFAPQLPDDVVLPPEARIIDELPAVRNDTIEVDEPGNERLSTDQMDLFSGSRDPGPKSDAVRTAAAKPDRTDSGQADDGLVTLYVRARESQQFTGTDLVKALNGVGMRYGDMAIFHHFGAGDLQCDVPVFSAANMFEPGHFNLGKIEAFRTSGLALFMHLPGPLDGPVAFELLLNTAQRLAALTDGEVYADPRSQLDPESIAHMRNRAGQFGDARP